MFFLPEVGTVLCGILQVILLIQILEEGVERCAADIYRQISDGSLDFAKVFIKTDVHPQAAGTYRTRTKLCIGSVSSFLLPVLERSTGR